MRLCMSPSKSNRATFFERKPQVLLSERGLLSKNNELKTQQHPNYSQSSSTTVEAVNNIPDPLGPMMAVNLWNGPMICLPL